MKQFTIYKHNQHAGDKTLWVVHRRYPTMAQANQAYIDLIKKPKKHRVWVYVVLPTLSMSKTIILKEEILTIAR